MKIASQRLVSLISKPFQYATILHSTTKTSLSVKPSFKHFCVVSLGHSRMYFSTSKDPIVEEPSANEQIDVQESNLQNYIKNPKTIEILQKKGIKTLFPIQIETFEAVYQSRDLLASDRTGSGKTIAYSLPIIQKLRDNGTFKSGKKQVKFLVMCPTRELTIQVYKEIATLRHSATDFNVVGVYGGASIDDQTRQLRNGVDVIVATPGRLMDLVERKAINFSELVATCIDQADQMLEKGFKLDIEEIFRLIENQRKQKTQNLMFSATIPEWVDKISNQYMDKSKKKINLISKSQTQTSTTVEHLAVECQFKDRLKCIQALIKTYNSNHELSTIIFSQTKLQVTDIAMEFGKDAAFLQGDMEQKERQFNLNAFRTGKRSILVATDVASRGLDIDNVGLVIQLEPPRNTEPFIHRAGRTGRAGRKGICITLFDKRKHLQSMIRIENDAKITFKHIARPQMHESQESWEKKLNTIPHKLKSFKKNVITNQKLDRMADVLIASHTDVKQLVKRQLAAISGEPPANISLTSEETGFKTFIIEMRQAESKINTMEILNFIKAHFTTHKVTNVHVQSSNIIFDIPEENLTEFREILSAETVNESPYKVKEASSYDREMTTLKDLAKSGGRRVFEQRDTRRSSRNDRNDRNDRNSEAAIEQGNGKLFIPRLPYEITESDIEHLFDQMKIKYDSLKLIKKSEENVFAFVQTSDSQSLNQLLKYGLNIDGQKIRAFISQKREPSQDFSRDGGRSRDNSFGKSSGQGYDKGYDRKDRGDYRKGGDSRAGRGQGRSENFDF